MTLRLGTVLALLMFGLGSAACAEDRAFCAARPGQATPPCTVEPRRVMAEIGLTDWSHDSDPSRSDDLVAVGEVLLRTGISPTAELQLGWTALGFDRQRDRVSGRRDHRASTGDVTVAVQQQLGRNGAPAAVRAFVTLPTGGAALGAGTWSAGAMLPVALPLNASVEFDLTPEIDAAADQDGAGRHLAYGGVVGIGLAVNAKLSLAFDASLFRDQDPTGHTTTEKAGLSLAWQAGRNLQFDLGAIIGLNANAVDRETYFGVVRRF